MKLVNLLNIVLLASLWGCSGNDAQESAAQDKQGSSIENFSILSYNTYLLKTGLKNTLVDERAQVMPDALASVGADILVLQEVWESEHVSHFITRLASHGYEYYAYVDSRNDKAELGNGKMIFSRYPIYEKTVSFSPWSTKTSWTEKMANKGLLSASVNINGRFVKVFNAHTSTKRMDAESGEFEPEHVAMRKQQFDQIIDAMNSDPTEAKILAADLNMHPFAYDPATKKYSQTEYDPEYLYVRDYSRLQNVFTDSEMQQYFTFDPQVNRWARDGIIVDDAESQLIDYQMYAGQLALQAKQIVMKGDFQIPAGSGMTAAPLSDHYGILSHFQIQ